MVFVGWSSHPKHALVIGIIIEQSWFRLKLSQPRLGYSITRMIYIYMYIYIHKFDFIDYNIIVRISHHKLMVVFLYPLMKTLSGAKPWYLKRS